MELHTFSSTNPEFLVEFEGSMDPADTAIIYMSEKAFEIKGKSQKDVEVLKTQIEVKENGPLLVYGVIDVTLSNGSIEEKSKTTAFCRCGASLNKPFCDGSHIKDGFKG